MDEGRGKIAILTKKFCGRNIDTAFGKADI